MAHIRELRWPSRGAMVRALGAAFLTSLATLGVIILAAVINLLYFNDPPVIVTALSVPPSRPLCPGEAFMVLSRIEVDRPALIYSYFSVMDENADHNINDTQVSNGPPRLHPHPAIFEQSLKWVVPNIPPGKYTRVLAFRGTDGRENSLFETKQFTIGANCK